MNIHNILSWLKSVSEGGVDSGRFTFRCSKGGGGIFWEGEVDSHVSGNVAYSC